jgi:hypothetical protein
MKKITLLIALLITSLGYSQVPTGAATTPPTRDSGDVVSIFTKSTDASTTVYSDVAGINYNPNWGSTSGNVAEETLNGDVVMKYPTFHYQGIVIGQNINLSAMTMMHVDIWTNSVSPNVFLISATTGERSVNVPAKAGSWSSVEIPISDFTSQGLSVNDIKEFKFDGGDSATDIYIDNIYFYKPATDPLKDATLSDLSADGNTLSGFSGASENYTVELSQGSAIPTVTATTTNANASALITQATSIPGDATVVVTSEDSSTVKTYTVSFKYVGPSVAAPTPNISGAGSIVSFYSDAYTDTTIDNFDAGWCGTNSVVEETISGNKMMHFSGNPCQGVDFAGNKIDATSFNRFRVDIFTDDSDMVGKTINFKFVDFGGGSSEASNIQIDVNGGTTPALVAGQWITVDVELTGTKADLAQIGITANLDNLWYDNMFLYNSATASVENNELLGFSMYPNPVSNRLNISAKETIQRADIFNVLGKKVMSLDINKTSESIDVSNLTSGIYLVKYNVNGTTGTAKFVKQ